MTDIIRRRGARGLVLFAAATLAASVAMPATAKPTDPPASGKEQTGDARKASKPVLYCEVETWTGSRIARKVCMTRKEWIDQTGVDPETLKH